MEVDRRENKTQKCLKAAAAAAQHRSSVTAEVGFMGAFSTSQPAPLKIAPNSDIQAGYEATRRLSLGICLLLPRRRLFFNVWNSRLL